MVQHKLYINTMIFGKGYQVINYREFKF